MAILQTRFPVCTLDGYELIPSGAALSDYTLNVIIEGAPVRENAMHPLLAHGTVASDLDAVLCDPPYDIIFAPARKADKARSLLSRANVPTCTLRALDYFSERDPYTYRHSLTVFALALLLAQDLLPGDSAVPQEIALGPSHDYGKISVPLDILLKPEGLTAEERLRMEHHTVAGYVLLAYELRDLHGLTAHVARDHHERMDGSGYPCGRHLSDRMVEIVAACDIYDALITPRPYRRTSYDNRTAIETITAMAGQGKISWDIVQALVACNRTSKPRFRDCIVSLEKRGNPPTDSQYGARMAGAAATG